MWITCHYLLASSKPICPPKCGALSLSGGTGSSAPQTWSGTIHAFVNMCTSWQSKLNTYWACGTNLHCCQSCSLSSVTHFLPLTKRIAAEGAHPLAIFNCNCWALGTRHINSSVPPSGTTHVIYNQNTSPSKFLKNAILDMTLLSLSSNTESGQVSKLRPVSLQGNMCGSWTTPGWTFWCARRWRHQIHSNAV